MRGPSPKQPNRPIYICILCMWIRPYIDMNTWIFGYVNVWIYTCVHACMYVCTYTHICMYYVCMYM
jgi:hypothetical protein